MRVNEEMNVAKENIMALGVSSAFDLQMKHRTQIADVTINRTHKSISLLEEILRKS